MGYYVLELELKIKNVMIFGVLYGYKMVAVILIEDQCNDRTITKNEAVAGNYQLKTTVFVLQEEYLADHKMIDSLQNIPKMMMQNQSTMYSKTDVNFSKSIEMAFCERRENYLSWINCILSFTETYQKRKIKAVEDRDHLLQRLIDEDGNVIE